MAAMVAVATGASLLRHQGGLAFPPSAMKGRIYEEKGLSSNQDERKKLLN
jgi:hypothetical protein